MSDLMLKTSLGSEGVGGWKEERRWTMGYRRLLYLFFKYNFNLKKVKKASIRSFLKLCVNANHFIWSVVDL